MGSVEENQEQLLEQGLDLLCDHNLSEPQVSKKVKVKGMKWGVPGERREMTVAIVSALASCLKQISPNEAGCATVSVTASCCRIVEILLLHWYKN